MTDEDAHPGTADILVAQAAELAYAKACGIQESHHGLLLQVRNGGDESPGFLLGRDIRKEFIKPACRELCVVPGFVEDVKGEEAQLGDGAVDGTVRQGALFLEPADEIPHLLPGDILRKFVEDMLQVVKIGTDVSRVAFEGMAGKAPQGNHFPVSFKISVHNGTSFVRNVKVSRISSVTAQGGGRIKKPNMELLNFENRVKLIIAVFVFWDC